MPNVKFWSNDQSLHLAGMSVGPADETKHFKFIGTTGTGKSTAITELLGGALARGDRAVIADPDGGYLSRFHERNRGDIILNPFEPRSVKWNPFAEIHTPYDVEQLASGLIPSTEDASSREWRGYARTFLSAVAHRCHQSGRADAGELWRLLAIASSNELRKVVAGTPAQPFLDADNARMFGSIRSVAAAHLAALEHIAQQSGPALSTRHWVRGGQGVGSRALFLPYTASQISALHSTISACRGSSFERSSSAASSASTSSGLDDASATESSRVTSTVVPPPRLRAVLRRAASTSTCRIARAAMRLK